MPLIFPKAEDPPTYPAQAVPDPTDLYALTGAVASTGVLLGCLVSPTSPAGMSVQVAGGSILSFGNQAGVSAVSSLTIAPPNTTDRRDIVVAPPNGGLPFVVTGTPCGVAGWSPISGLNPPVKPSLPSNAHVLLGEVYVQAGAISITAGNIVDKTTTVVPAQTPTLLFGQTTYVQSATPPSPQNTKQAMHVLAQGNAAFNGTVFPYTDMCNRLVFTPVVTPIKCRFRIRNSNLWGGGGFNTSPIQITGIYWGTPTVGGTWNGTFTAVPTLVDPGNGSAQDIGTHEYVGPWFTPPASAQAGIQQAISLGYTTTSGGVNAGSPGGWLWTGAGSSAAAGGTAAPTSTLTGDPTAGQGTAAFDVRLEYQFVGSNSIGLFIGTSLTQGFIGSGNNGTSPGPDHAWPNQAGRRLNHCIENGGQVGGTLAFGYSSSSELQFARFYDSSWTSGPPIWPGGCVPDYCVLHFPFNDLGQSLTYLQTRMLQLVALIKSMGIKKVLLATELPTATPIGFLSAFYFAGANSSITLQGYPFFTEGLPYGGSPGSAASWVTQIWIDYPASGLMEGPFTVTAANSSTGQLTLQGGTSFANAHFINAPVFQYTEGMRQQYNQWVRSGPTGVDGVIDLALMAEAGSTPPNTQSPLWYTQAANAHLSAAGYAALAQHFASSFAGL